MATSKGDLLPSCLFGNCVFLLLATTCRLLVGAEFDLRVQGAYATSRPALHVAVAGHYAYVAAIDGLSVIDVLNPVAPRQVGRYGTTPFFAVNVVGKYAYVATGLGLTAIDVSTPENPRVVGQIPTLGSALGIAVAGNFAYVAAGSAGLQVIDVTDPSNPLPVGGCDTSGNSWDVVVSGRYAYVADRSGGLVVIDVGDPSHPQCVGGYPITDARCVAVSGTYAYVADLGGRLFVVDVRDPAHPQLASAFNTQGLSHDIAVVENHAYLVSPGTLELVDVGTATSPRQVGLCRMAPRSSAAYGGVSVSGGYAYVADYDGGLKVVDVGTLANPQRLGWIDTDGEARDVAVKGDYAYVADYRGGLKTVAVSNPAAPHIVSLYYTFGRACGITVAGSYAYLASLSFQEGQFVYDGEGLMTFDLSNPGQPQQIRNTFFWDISPSTHYSLGARSVTATSNRVFLADGSNGLREFDIGDPTNAVALAVFQGGGFARSVAAAGDYVYVAKFYYVPSTLERLVALSFTNPASLQQVGGYRTNGFVSSVAVSGSRAYLAARGEGLEIVDISDLSAMRRLGGIDTWDALDVAVEGSYAYVADGNNGLRVIDISDPSRPQEVGGNSLFYASAVVVNSNRVFVTAGKDGLVILKTYQPPPRLERFQFGPFGFQMTATSAVEQWVRIDHSTDLYNWEPWVMLFVPHEGQALVDPSVSLQGHKFYRAVVP